MRAPMRRALYIYRRVRVTARALWRLAVPAARAVEARLPESPRRRAILKYSVFGGGAFLAGKVLGPGINLFGGADFDGKMVDFKNFRVVESSKGLAFYDKWGNEILMLEKDDEAGR